MDSISKTRGWYKIERRTTLLKAHELKPWYLATMELNQETTRDYLHFLLFTGLRRSEGAGLRWETVDFDDRSFVIPDTKNREPHYLPMSDVVEQILQRRRAYTDGPWVFPSPMTDGPLVEPKTAIARVTELSGLKINLHDLRRTFITIAESLDIPAYALKRLMNHKNGNDVTAGYIIPNAERLREPMQRIADYLSSQCKGA